LPSTPPFRSDQDPALLALFATSRPLERAAVLASWPQSVSPAPPRLSLLRSGPGSMPRGRSSCWRVGRDGGLARRGGPWSPALARVPPPRGEIARCVPTPLEVPARLDTADPLPRDRQGGIAWPRRTAAPDPDAMTDPGSGDAKKRGGHPCRAAVSPQPLPRHGSDGRVTEMSARVRHEREAPGGFEPPNRGFAVLSLRTPDRSTSLQIATGQGLGDPLQGRRNSRILQTSAARIGKNLGKPGRARKPETRS